VEDNFHLGIKALIKNSKGEILLLKVNAKQLFLYSGEAYWDIPGGRIQKGQTVEETLRREVEKETGIKSIKSFKPFEMVLSNLRIPLNEGGDVGLILSSYVCDIENTDKIVLSDEHVGYKWFSPDKASKLLEFKYHKEFAEKIKSLK